MSLCDGDETAEPRLRRQQVVVTLIPSAFAHVVADGEQMAGPVIEEFPFHAASHFSGKECKVIEKGDAFPRDQARLNDESRECIRVAAFLDRLARPGLFFDGQRQLIVKAGQLTQCWNAV